MTAGSARAGRCTEACSASHAPRSPLAPTCAERPASPHRLLGCAGAWPRTRRRPSLDVQLRALCAAVLGLCFRVVGARGCAAAVPAGVLLARRLSRAGPTAHRVRPVVVGPRRVGRALLSRPLGSWRGRHAEAAELSRAVAGSAVALGGFLCCGWAMDGADAVAGRDPAGLESEASPGRKRSSSLNPCHRRPRLQLAVRSEKCREEACYYLLPRRSWLSCPSQ